MNLEVGMYVRTINGKIWIITSQKALFGHRIDIIKASYNIIDLIEVGDYINGMKLTKICFDKDGEKILTVSCYLELVNKDIKSIVTKEQFESMSYKVC